MALALGALAPLASFAQQSPKVWRIGLLWPSSKQQPTGNAANVRFFLEGLRDLGYVEGRNMELEWRFADFHYERLPGLAEELVRLRVDVIVTVGTPGVRAAQRATKSIPIVVASFADPVAGGFARSLAHPSGNITGLSQMGEDVDGKRVELLSSVLPKSTRIAFLLNPDNPTSVRIIDGLNASLGQAGKGLLIVKARGIDEISEGISLMVKQRAGAFLVGDDTLLNSNSAWIAKLALQHKLPSLLNTAQGAEAGALMSFGTPYADMLRRAATIVDKILKGAKPGDLPIEQPTKFELVINLKTAKTLGLTFPQSVLVRADRVIE